jgi:NADH-quinone oxidoreductase subunit H
MALDLFNILVFPGFLFLGFMGLIMEYVDRKVHARLQNRIGPPWFQPLADFIKLSAKEEIIPKDVNRRMFKIMPIVALTAAITSFFYIPMWGTNALFSFQGDLIVVLYLLTIPTITFFLGGYYSISLYSMIGAIRAVTQLFAYEVSLFLSVLSPAIIANTWSLSEMAVFYSVHPWFFLFNLIGFGVSIIALLGKLEKIPFDIPEAETEIVAGTFTEYTGRLLALFRMTIDIELVVGTSLLAAVFLPFWFTDNPYIGFFVYIGKICVIILLITLLRTIFARLRIDQMMDFCWKYLAPLALLQVIISLIIKGLL